VSIFLLGVFPAWPASAEEPPWPEACTEEVLGGQIILTCLPDNWHGRLLIYAHGYVAPQEELSLPADELGQARLPDGRSIIDVLLEIGFAFATTSYSKNGYAVQNAEGDLNALVDHFNTQVAPRPAHTVYLTGASEGGLVTTMMVEKFPDRYHGGLAMCGPVGGAPYQLQYVGDFRVVFDVFFPGVFEFGAADVPEDAYLRWESDYAPAVREAILNRHWKRWQLFNVTQAAWIPWEHETAVTTAETLLRYSVVGTNDLAALAGGAIPYNNVNTQYQGSFNDWRLNRKVERVAGDPTYLFYWYQTTGKLERPLVTLHTFLDGAVPFLHEVFYSEIVKSQGRSHFLTVLPVMRYGHCEFEAAEVLGAFAILILHVENQVQEGLQPFIEGMPEPLE
jgi:pimeloyl-ACP methyl ester carboxylesterase